MAKRIPTMSLQIESNLVAGTHTIRFLSYGEPDDTIDGTIEYKRLNGALGMTFPHTVTGGELSGTLQALLDTCKADCEQAEGVV